jgi:beta-N-acetylhexosaminidase
LPDERSAQRRFDLLPNQPPLAWDDLMVSDIYLAALDAVYAEPSAGPN